MAGQGGGQLHGDLQREGARPPGPDHVLLQVREQAGGVQLKFRISANGTNEAGLKPIAI